MLVIIDVLIIDHNNITLYVLKDSLYLNILKTLIVL